MTVSMLSLPALVLNGAQIHIVVNHIAVVGVGFGVLFGLAGLLLQKKHVVQVALWMFVISGVAAVPTYFSGEAAEEIVEDQVGHDIIEPHEEIASKAAIATGILGFLALLMLFLTRSKPIPRSAITLVLIAGLFVSGLLAYTAHLGGLINHPEIRDGAVQVDDHGDRDDRGRDRVDDDDDD